MRLGAAPSAGPPCMGLWEAGTVRVHCLAPPCAAGFGGPGRFTLGGVGSWEMARRLQGGL